MSKFSPSSSLSLSLSFADASSTLSLSLIIYDISLPLEPVSFKALSSSSLQPHQHLSNSLINPVFLSLPFLSLAFFLNYSQFSLPLSPPFSPSHHHTTFLLLPHCVSLSLSRGEGKATMAVACKNRNFSIREYVMGMRTTDVAKSSPFGGDAEAVEALLPPIDVAKFRYWADELHLMTSQRVSQKKQPKVAENKSQETGAAANSHAPRRRHKEQPKATEKAKAKVRTPKKRSIVEIFAESPLIEVVDYNKGSSSDDDVENLKQFVSSTKKRKKKSSSESRLKTETAATVSKIKREKLKNIMKKSKKRKIDQSLKKKTSLDFTRKVDESIANVEPLNDIVVSVSIRTRKPSAKSLSAEKRRKVQISKSIATSQKRLSALRGIYKKYNRAMSRQKSFSVLKKKVGNQFNICGSRQSSKQARFSSEDDALGPRKKLFASIDCPEISSHIVPDASPSIKFKQVGGDKASNAIEVTSSDDEVSVSAENQNEDQPININEPSVRHTAYTSQLLQPDLRFQEELHSGTTVFPSQAVPVGHNLHAFDLGCRIAKPGRSCSAFNPITLNGPSYDASQVISVLPRVGNNLKTEMSTYLPRFCDDSVKLLNFEGSSSIVAPKSSVGLKAFQQASSSVSSNQTATWRSPFVTQGATETCEVYWQKQPKNYPSTGELIDCFRSYPVWKKQEIMFGERWSDENFSGLPLNSRGVLIQSSSCSQSSFGQVKKPPTITASAISLPFVNHRMPSSLKNFSIPTEKHFSDRVPPPMPLNYQPTQNYVKESQNQYFQSGVCKPEVRGIGETNVYLQDCINKDPYSYSASDLDLKLTNLSLQGSSQDDKFKNRRESLWQSQEKPKHAYPTTVRLMGKDVAVGKSSKGPGVCEDGKIWTDKEIIAEHRPPSTDVSGSSVQKHENSRENIACSSGVHENQASKRNLHVNATQRGFSYPYSHWKNDSMSLNGCSTAPGTANSSANSYVHPPHPPAVFDGAIDMHEKSQDHCTKPAFRFPFPHPGCREAVRLSSSQRLFKGLPSWFLQATEQSKTPISLQPYFQVAGSHKSAANFMSVPSVRNPSSVSHPYNSLASNPHFMKIPAPSSCVHPLLIPVPPELKPPLIGRSSGNIKKKVYRPPVSLKSKEEMLVLKNTIKGMDRVKLKPPCLRNTESDKTIQNSYVETAEKTKPAPKLPSPGMVEAFGPSAFQKAKEAFADGIICNDGLSKVDCSGDKITSSKTILKENQKNELKTSSPIDSGKREGIARSHLTKLSAGAKHILGPRKKPEKGKARPTHLTVPFASVTKSISAQEAPNTNQVNSIMQAPPLLQQPKVL